jgi:uncharacterized repeat protein (TIGR01451 family)
MWAGVGPAVFVVTLAVASTLLAPAAAAQSINITPIGTLQPDLTAALTASRLAVGGGETAYYTVTIRNPGLAAGHDLQSGTTLYLNTPANNVKFTLRMPAGTPWASIQSATGLRNHCDFGLHPVECSGFNCDFVGLTLTCTGGHIDAAGSAAFDIRTEAPTTAGTYMTTLTVDPGHSIAERVETNNIATASIAVQRPDLTIGISPAASTVEDGGTLTYVLNVANIGPSAEARDVTVQLTLPAGATATADRSRSDGTCSFAAPVLTCRDMQLAAAHTSQSATRRITASVSMPRINGPVSLTAVVDPANAIAERNDTNNSASVTTTIVGRPDLSASANQWLLSPLMLVRDVTVRNTGLVPATAVDVSIDSFNDGLFDGRSYWHNVDSVLSSGAGGGGFTCTASRTVTPDRPDFAEGHRLRCSGGSIPVGGSVLIEQVYLLGVGGHSGDRWTSVVVDPDNTLGEQNETNNTASDT